MRSCSSCDDRGHVYSLGGWCCRICARLSAYVLQCAREEWARIEASDG